VDVGQIILVATRHFGEDEIDRGRAKEGQSVKTLNDAKASREPVGREDDLQLSKQMGEIESFGPEFRICALLGLPEIQVLLFGGDPGQRKNGVNVVRGGEFSRTVWITQCKRGPAKESSPLAQSDCDQVFEESAGDYSCRHSQSVCGSPPRALTGVWLTRRVQCGKASVRGTGRPGRC